METYATAPWVINDPIELVAIEAKITRWREALAQAHRYRAFADRTYVALPSEIIDRTEAIGECAHRMGIGLIAVTSTSASVILESPSVVPRTADRMWIVGRTVGFTLPSISS